MKTIKITNDRRFNQSSISIGFLDENNIETIKFEIPEEYQEYSKMACFKTKDGTFTKIFDELTTNYLTLTNDITKYSELDMSIVFVDNTNSIVARTSILHLIIENTIIDNSGDVQPDDPKVVILNELIDKVSNINVDLEDNILTITRADRTSKSLNVKGDKGDTGEQGIQGIQGEQGVQGDKGDKGETGNSGVAVSTTEPGDDVNVWINPDGTADEYLLATSPAGGITDSNINTWNNKQNKLIAGANITIVDDVISSTGGNGLNAINIIAGDNIELTQEDSNLTIKAVIPEDVSPIILDENKIKELCDLSHLLSDNQVFVGYLCSKYGDGLFYVNSKFYLNHSSDTSITDEYDYIDVGSVIIVTGMGKSIIAFTKNWNHSIKYYNCINTYGGSNARYELTTLTNEELYNLIENYDNVLTKTNEEEYTPTNDYNPATKIYVDEKVKADRGIYYAEIFGTKWYDKATLQPILDLAYKGGFSDVLIRANTGGRYMTITGMNLQNLTSSTTTDITFGALSNLVGNYLTPTTINYGYVYANKVGLDSSGNVVINGTTGIVMGSVDLMKGASGITGYDSTKTQVLKNVKGTLQWVSE